MIDIKKTFDNRVLLRIGKLSFHLSKREAKSIRFQLNKMDLTKRK